MHYLAVTRSKAPRENEVRLDTARRVLRQILDLDLAQIDESGTLADFEGCSLPDVAGPLTRMGWRIRVQDRVFACFGVTCDIDEPLSTLIARIELAEHGVRCTLAH